MKPLEWLGSRIKILDQTCLPQETVYLETDEYSEVAAAIREMLVRGAPAIGVAAAYGVALGALKIETKFPEEFRKELKAIIQVFTAARPTAVNLFKAVVQMEQAALTNKNVDRIKQDLVNEAVHIHRTEMEATDKLCSNGSQLIDRGASVLTHCNTGPLATAGYGTALGAIIYAHKQEKKIHVYVGETRPLLQGARLTALELKESGVPFTLITDSMAGYFMKQKKIQSVIVGADRIAANGDTANKIGTYSLAVLARYHDIPFYVVAPTSTIDSSIATGDEIVIEERSGEEVTFFKDEPIAPEGTIAANPAFDVTPASLISGFVTEKEIYEEPYDFKGIS